MMSYNFVEKILIYLLIMGMCIADPETVYGNKGTSFTFICPYKKTITDNVVWDYSYNTTFTVSDGESISISPIMDRVKIVGNHTVGEYNLELRQLQESDEVLYRCNVGVKVKEYKLELLAPPSLLTLQDVTDNKIRGTEGQSLTLRCTATGGKPPPLVTMTVGNVPTVGNQTVAYTIPTLQRQHDGQIVQCNANSSALTSPLVAAAALDLYFKPLQPIFSPDPISIEETKPLVVSCTSDGSRPAATFQWTIGLANVTSGSTTQSTLNTADNTYTVTSILRYNVDRTYNEQTIACTAVNVASINGTSKMLDVKFAPDINVTNVTYSQDKATRTVTCNIKGNPTTYTYYRWKHKSMYGVLIRELDGGQILTLPNVSVEARYQDSGEYVCTASNGITGRDGKINQTGSGYVTVNAKPVLIISRNRTEYGEFRKDVDVHVYVYSVPKYTSVMWYKTNTPISTTDKYALADTAATVTDTFHGTKVLLDGYRVTLTIKNLTESDFNVSYRVEMKNDLGLSNFTIFLESASAPQTPLNFKAPNSTESSILVQWEAGYNGGHEQTFYVEYRGSGSSTWVAVKIQDSKQTGRQTYILTGLRDGTFYELRMYAENKFNKSLPTEPVLQETVQGASKAPQIGPIIGGVAGGLAAVLFIIGIIWFMVFKRKQDTTTPSKKPRSRSDSDVPDGLQQNILYQSSGSDFKPLVPKEESGKQIQKPSMSETEYAEVQKPNAVYAAVDKTQQKNVQDKNQKDKKKRPKKTDKKAHKVGNNNQGGDYPNAGISLKDMGEGEYANSEDRHVPPTSHKNPQGLEYADLSFTKQIPQKGKKPVIHGEDRTLYSEVDHSKKAPPPPQESAYEETNFKHG